jgi:hypothetical protein
MAPSAWNCCRDIRYAFGDDDVIRSSDLVAKLTADPAFRRILEDVRGLRFAVLREC